MSVKMKCLMFEETGELMRGADGEWVRLAEIKTKGEYRCLKLTEYSSNPLEPIIKWTKKNPEELKVMNLLGGLGEIGKEFGELAKAVSECMSIVESKQ